MQGFKPAFEQAQRDVKTVPNIDALRGLEGTASRHWFQLFGSLIKQGWKFDGRKRRPPPDPINALLSLGYTWLLGKTIACIESQGMEVNVGMLHAYRAGRPSLACDLMEPLRVPAVDRWVLQLLNGKLVRTHDFESDQRGGVKLVRQRFSDILLSWQQHWLQGSFDRKLDGEVREFSESLYRLLDK